MARLPRKLCQLVILEIGGDEGGAAMVTLLHEFEKDVGLFGFQVEIAQLIDEQEVQAGETLQQLARGTVRQRRIHLVKQILRPDELSTIAILQGF